MKRLFLLSAGLLASWAAEPQALEIDQPHSFIVAIARRAGVLGFLGHDHAVLATKWTAEACGDGSHVQVRIETGSLVIDSPDALAKAQIKSSISPSDRNSLEEKIMSPRFFDASKFPAIEFKGSAQRERAGPDLVVHGTLTIHGTSHPVSAPIHARPAAGGKTEYTGSFEIKQSDYGIEPESIAGVVKVQDPVEIRFDIVTSPSQKACSP